MRPHLALGSVIAVAERSESGAAVYVYNLRTLYKRKVLSTPEISSVEYVSMAFSADDSLLYTQGGGPEWMLGCWLWEKAKVRHAVPSLWCSTDVLPHSTRSCWPRSRSPPPPTWPCTSAT